MRKLSRRQKENQLKTKNVNFSTIEEAIDILKQTSTVKFVETVELHANLNIDPKYANQQLRTTVSLPNGIGKSIKIAVLTNEANHSEANKVGADIVGDNDLIEQISQGNIEFDLLVSKNTSTEPWEIDVIARLGTTDASGLSRIKFTIKKTN